MKLLKNLIKNKEKWILFFIFLIVLASRLYFVFQTPYFNDSGYLNYKLIEHISETGKPMLYDSLSYNGRDLLYSPVYHYILAFFDLALPLDFVLKVIPNIFSSLLVFVIFGLVYRLIKDKVLALFVALLSGFIPIVFVETLNNISVYSLVLPLVFYLLYLFIKIDEEKNIGKFVFFTFLLAILHPSAFLFLIALLFFVVLMTSEDITISKLKKEIIAFSVFLILFVEFLIYKKAFSIYGFGVVRDNVPIQFLDNYFNFSFLGIVVKIGFFVILFGLLGIMFNWRKKKEEVMLMSSVILSTLVLLWLKLINFEVGLMFLGIASVIVSCYSIVVFTKYLSKTKLENYKNIISIFSILILVFSIVIPSFLDASKNIQEETPTSYEILVLEWIKENALPDVTILAPMEKGHLINVISGKRNVMDNDFLLAPETSEKFKDINIIYSTRSEIKALDLLHKHNVDYIFVPVETELKFGRVSWLDDEGCFEGIFFGTPKIYKILC